MQLESAGITVQMNLAAQVLEFRRVRIAAHRSLADVARTVGTNPSTLSRWERGVNVPRADVALRWFAVIEGMIADHTPKTRTASNRNERKDLVKSQP